MPESSRPGAPAEPSPPSPMLPTRRFRHCFTLAFLLFGAGSALTTGCESERLCPGGRCACTDAECADGQRCVQNECRDACADQDDCPLGQNCAVYEFPDGTREQRCVVLAYASSGRTGQFEPCERDDECDTPRGFACIDGSCEKRNGPFESCTRDAECIVGTECVESRCSIPCTSHFDCRGFGTCAPLGAGTYCTKSDPEPEGRYYSACPGGPSDCATEAGFFCLGAGEGDLDAFCTSDCSSDDDCPTGFRCGTVGAVPCQDACGERGAPTSPGCVPRSEIGEGRRYHCGGLGLLRSVCLPRTFCAPCESDADCLAVPGQVCARDESGEKICTVACDPRADSCPWGTAAQCGVWDEERGIATCSHRFGSCRGTGKTCEPCIGSEDCPRGFCAVSSFSGERYCIDLEAECACGDDAGADGTCKGHGCPESPGGLTLTCLAEGRYAGDPLENRCFAGEVSSRLLGGTPQLGCWPR